MHLQSLWIEQYQTLKEFKMYFLSEPTDQNGHPKSNQRVRLNLLVGPNGAGKSSLLDALFEFASKAMAIDKNSSIGFRCELKWKPRQKSAETIIIGNKEKPNNFELLPWKRVIRLHTGFTERNPLKIDSPTFSLTEFGCRYALFVVHLLRSGQESSTVEDIWSNVNHLLWKNPTRPDSEIQPQIAWLDINTETGDSLETLKEELNKYIPLSAVQAVGQNKVRLYWHLNKDVPPKFEDSPWSLFQRLIEESEKGVVLDAGFLFSKAKVSDKLIRSQALSDGELGFYSRFALIYLLRFIGGQLPTQPTATDLPEAEKTEPIQASEPSSRCLVLLDEPEVHFNEYWKAEFLYYICECFKDSEWGYDFFIATHSAMLVSDAKPEEIHRLQQHEAGVMVYPPPINTFGANPVDIGRTLFMMEADIGKRSRTEIEAVLKKEISADTATELKTEIQELIQVVGPGEWRWRLRTRLREVERELSRKQERT